MTALEKAGSAQTRKIYLRHGGTEPMFGVSFATQKALYKKIRQDHALAVALWKTGNLDARLLAVKIADPAKLTSRDLDRWVKEGGDRMMRAYLASLVADGPLGPTKLAEWLSRPKGPEKCTGWSLLATLAMRDAQIPDAQFAEYLETIERTIHTAPNEEREGMLNAVIAIGCRSAELRKAATAAAKRIGQVEIDYGETDCKTPDVVPAIDKAWVHSTSKGFASPAAHERSRESMRLRC
ncbi:MAG: DNA alkylation repair protein [Myxococcaceae bacterium]|nr:DNA alkylation repair protein [Myxococcaceae bacterium]